MAQDRVAARVFGVLVVSLLPAAGCAPVRAGRAIESAADFQTSVLAEAAVGRGLLHAVLSVVFPLSPTLDKLEAEYAGRVQFFRVNSVTSPDVAARYVVYAAPTTLLFRDGREFERLIGAKPAWTVRRKLDAMLKGP